VINYNLFLGYITPLGSTLFLDNYTSERELDIGDEVILSGNLLELSYNMLSIQSGNLSEKFRVIRIEKFEENPQSITGDLYIVFEKDYQE